MTGEEKKAFAEAAAQAWSVWEENAAIEVLAPEESERVRRRLLANKEGSKILTPRYVFTDRHEGLRTALNPLPLKARAGVIAPGLQGHLLLQPQERRPYRISGVSTLALHIHSQ